MNKIMSLIICIVVINTGELIYNKIPQLLQYHFAILLGITLFGILYVCDDRYIKYKNKMNKNLKDL